MESSLSSTKITEILISIPDLSPDWLLLGIEPMLRSAAKPHAQPIEESSNTAADPTALALIKRIEELASENARLKAQIEELKKEHVPKYAPVAVDT